MKRTPAQRRNLLILRDEILPGIAEGKLNMRSFYDNCGTPMCPLGHAVASRKINQLSDGIYGDKVFGLDDWQWVHIFGGNLPHDPSWLAANITDLLEVE